MKKNLFFLMLMGAMASCGNAPQNNENSEVVAFDSSAVTISDEVPGVSARPLSFEAVDGKWMLKSVKDVNVESGDTSAYIIFNLAEQTIHATAGCNSINGTINRNGRSVNSLSFDNMMMTRMMCPDRDALEQALNDALNNTRAFELVKGELTLRNENDEVLLKATK